MNNNNYQYPTPVCIDDQWHYSPERAMASLTGFMIVCSSTMWGYQLQDRPVLYTLIQPSDIQ
jgi:hypothetical protein